MNFGGVPNKINQWKNRFENYVNLFKLSLNHATMPLKRVLKPYINKITNNKYFQIVSSVFNKYSMYFVLVLILVIFAIVQNGSILTPNNIKTVLFQNSYVIIMAFGMLFVIVSGNIDLSVGSLIGFYSAMGVLIQNAVRTNLVVTVFLLFLLSVGIGFFQGFLIGYIKIPSFIITLGGMLLFAGLQKYLVSINQGSIGIKHGTFQDVWQQYFRNAIPDFHVNGFYIVAFILIMLAGLTTIAISVYNWYKKYTKNLFCSKLWVLIVTNLLKLGLTVLVGYWIAASSGGLEWYLIYLAIIFVVFYFIASKTVFGRNIYSIGGNKKAAELSGVNLKKTTLKVFILMSILAGVGSLFLIASNQLATAEAGVGEELNVIASVFVGGASAYGGIGSVINTFIGSLVLSFINNGLNLTQVDANLRFIVKGAVLILAVAYDVISRKRTS